MSSTNEESTPRKAKEHPEEGELSPVVPTTPHRFHQEHKRGGLRDGSMIAARLTKEVVTMSANMRSITQQTLPCKSR